MPLDRRSVLRTAAQTAAAGALATGCSDDHRTAVDPAVRLAPPARAISAVPTTMAPPPAPPIPAQVDHGPRDRPAVALTFHGQGSPAIAQSLLGEAERAGARVTVLAVGSWLDEYPQMARRILDGGHDLGNHTQNHRNISAMSAAAAAAEITRCADRIRRLTGGVGSWFRPSQTQYASPLLIDLARQAGYPHVLSYDLDSLDYTDPGSAAVRGAVLTQVRQGSIASLHFGHPGTVAALPEILDALRQRNLRAVTATALLS